MMRARTHERSHRHAEHETNGESMNSVKTFRVEQVGGPGEQTPRCSSGIGVFRRERFMGQPFPNLLAENCWGVSRGSDANPRNIRRGRKRPTARPAGQTASPNGCSISTAHRLSTLAPFCLPTRPDKKKRRRNYSTPLPLPGHSVPSIYIPLSLSL